MAVLSISKKDTSIVGIVRLPASKSLSNRALIIRYLSGKEFPIKNLSEADDTILLKRLLLKVKSSIPSEKEIILDCANAGTVFRFLTALLSMTPGKWLLTGSDRMKERPIGILTDALRKLGAKIDYTEKENYPPLLITGHHLKGSTLEMDASVSSQFISALLMIAPVLPKGLTVNLYGIISSEPYLKMTLGLLKKFRVQSHFIENSIEIKNQAITPENITIEADWSSAAFWYEVAAFSSVANIFLQGLTKESLQGDAILPEIYKHFGVYSTFEQAGTRLTKTEKVVDSFSFDFTNYPDLAQAVIITCAGLNIPGEFTGLESLQIKETDRLSALKTELQKLGYQIHITQNSELRTSNFELRTPNPELKTLPITSTFKIKKPTLINPYNDHRMAMAFAPLALIFGSIQIENPEVVSKSYPGFWEDFRKMGIILKYNSSADKPSQTF
ncbi:MAG: 3-phosphoshikimate 1-carboxyvinyltransferase [Bacteroidales bacterium]